MSKWYIGIDFGTTNSRVVMYDAVSQELYANQNLTKDIRDIWHNIPTVVALELHWQPGTNKISEKYYVGAEKEQRPLLWPFRYLKEAARNFDPPGIPRTKAHSRITDSEVDIHYGDSIEFGYDECPYLKSPQELLKIFFKRILQTDELNIKADEIEKIVVGKPGIERTDNSTIKYDNVLKKAIASCFGKEDDDSFKDKIDVKPEAELAGIAYLYGDEDRAKKKVLVIDIGGGTTDFSILQYDDSGKVRADNIGACNTAGNAIDSFIFDLLKDAVDKDKKPGDNKNIIISRQACTAAKMNLFVQQATGTKNTEIKPETLASLKGKSSSIRETDYLLTYNPPVYGYGKYICLQEGCRYVNGTKDKHSSGKNITSIFEKIWKDLDQSLSGKNDINTIFFFGGTSIVTPLREHIIEKINNEHRRKAFADAFSVVTSFEPLNLFAVDEEDILIDTYSAVAVGAFICAMGGELRTVPKLEGYTINNGVGKINYSKIEKKNKVLISLGRKVLIATASLDKDIINVVRFANRSTNPDGDIYLEHNGKEILRILGNMLGKVNKITFKFYANPNSQDISVDAELYK